MTGEAIDPFLAAIERTEVRSLTWGYVDGSLAYDDLAALFAEVVGNGAVDLDAMLDDMLGRALLVKSWSKGSARYRSRFAETLRLLVHLRQVTPSKGWDVAPDLVSDYRVTTGPRRVPKRALDIQEVLAAWSATPRWNGPRERSVRSYLEATESRLSRFQVEVGSAVFGSGDRDAGLVVTAGTGAGKTLAYYLPITIELAQLVAPNEYWTKSVSLYPRTELLKDQLSEVFRISTHVPTAAGPKRPLRLGALFEPVPNTAADVAGSWQPTKRGYVCPFLRCPACEADLVWSENDIRANRELSDLRKVRRFGRTTR